MVWYKKTDNSNKNMSNNYSPSSGSAGDGYGDNGYGDDGSGYRDDGSGYRGSYRGGYRGRGRGAYRGRGNDRGGYYGRGGGYLSRYNPYYGGSSRGRGGYSSYQDRDNYRQEYDTSRPTSQGDDNYQDSYQEGYSRYGDEYGAGGRTNDTSYGYSQSLYRGSYRGGYKGTYSSKDRGSYHGRTSYESERAPGSHLGWKEHSSSSPASKPKTPQHKSAPGPKPPSNPWITILQIKDDAVKHAFEHTHEELGRVDKELYELQHSKLLLENSVANLERQALREELHVQITNEKLEEFTYL